MFATRRKLGFFYLLSSLISRSTWLSCGSVVDSHRLKGGSRTDRFLLPSKRSMLLCLFFFSDIERNWLDLVATKFFGRR